MVTPELAGFLADYSVIDGQTVDYNSANLDYVVKYAAPTSTVAETKSVTQTVKYEYADGVTAGRPTLPTTNVQTLTFNRVEETNPFTGEVLSSTWTPAQHFTVVKTPTINGFYAD